MSFTFYSSATVLSLWSDIMSLSQYVPPHNLYVGICVGDVMLVFTVSRHVRD